MTERKETRRMRREETREAPENLIVGRNAVREALRAGREMEKLLVARGDRGGSLAEILALAREKGVVVQEVDRRRLDEMAENHQGVAALASMHAYASVEEILQSAREKGEAPFVVVLDGITDPHNLGAIVRTAECMGAHGVIIPERRAVGLTPAAMKAAAGALEWVKVARVTNLTRALEELKAQNLWTYAMDMDGEDFRAVDYAGGCALIVGAEGQGVSRLVKETCDRVVSIPMKGHIESLNASVAAGIVLGEIARQRG